MDIDMDTRLKKPCTPSTALQDCSDSLIVDRFSTLPVEVLIRILSLLPTKDVGATCVLSNWLMRHVFPLITDLDLDDSFISHCLDHPSGIERFSTFVNFVDFVLRNRQSQYLNKFRLAVGADFKGISSDLKSMKLNSWISFPLTSCGLRELELCIRVREGGECQLFPGIFTCKTLEVLKLDVNLGFEEASTMSYFHLPKLKKFHLVGAFICVDNFLARLVSSCPLLEDLNVDAQWDNARFANISSPSLQRMCLYMDDAKFHLNKYVVLINTPNLEYLDYTDDLAYQYTITNMDRLAKAKIFIRRALEAEEIFVSFQQMLSLITSMSNVQHLILGQICTEVLKFAELKDHQLPLFRNLNYLELAFPGKMYWDNLLLPFLNRSPVLETLVFPRGFTSKELNAVVQIDEEAYRLEREFCRTTLAVKPLCCRYHLRRIVIEGCFGSEREIDLIQFLLRHASVLEELAITFEEDEFVRQDQMTFERTVQNLPRASATCLIQVQQN